MDIRELSSGCLSCSNPFCEKHCPLHNRISDIIKEIKKGDYLKAREILDETSPFPYICSRVCNYEKQCYGNCVKNCMNTPVKVYEIEKILSEIELTHVVKKKNGIRIAIIGAGVSGLAMAKILSIKGYEVHVFEKENFIGGTIYTGIPEYRLDRSYIKRIEDEMQDLNVNIHLNTKYPKDIDIQRLKDEGYEKIIFAIGNTVSNRMNLENDKHALNGLDVLYDLNVCHKQSDYSKYDSALVVGGGNVAFDCARSLKRIIEKVTIVYRRSIKEMPANRDEIDAALNEGVIIKELVNPCRIDVEGDHYCVKCQKMRLNGIGDDGRSLFEVIEDDYEYLDTGLFVMVIGQKTEKYDDGLTRDRSNNILTDDLYGTDIDGVYAIGDCVSGPSNVAQAIYNARRCIELNEW